MEFANALRKVGATVSERYYEGWSHTDPILEAPFVGDHRLHRDVYDFVKLWTESKKSPVESTMFLPPFDDNALCCRQICPQIMVTLGRFFNPF